MAWLHVVTSNKKGTTVQHTKKMEQDKQSKSLLQPTNMSPVSNQQHTLPRKNKRQLYIYYMYYNVCIYYIYSNKYDQTKNNMDILHCLQLHLVTPSFRERTAGFWSPALVWDWPSVMQVFFGGMAGNRVICLFFIVGNAIVWFRVRGFTMVYRIGSSKAGQNVSNETRHRSFAAQRRGLESRWPRWGIRMHSSHSKIQNMLQQPWRARRCQSWHHWAWHSPIKVTFAMAVDPRRS